MSRLNFLEETRYEKIPVSVYKNKFAASKMVANKIADIISKNDQKGTYTVLGLATGSSPVDLYAELIKLYKEENLSFKNVITFNLDEYFPMDPKNIQSYVYFMDDVFFNHVDIPKENINIPDGTLNKEEITKFCFRYEEKIKSLGGIDLQILGIGRTGHVGFNEPGSAPNSGTRLVTLNDLTRKDASKQFGGKENVPTKAITMGVGTIFKAREIVLMAWSIKKASIVKKAVEGEISGEVPSSYLQMAENVEFVVDQEAASELTRFDTPWLVKDCVWTEPLIKKAVIWLSFNVNKPILKLTEEDYNNNGMAQLATEYGPAYNINIKIFNQLQHTITGWPGGKPEAPDFQRPERAEPSCKKSLIFSPHPDDDVVSMGGTFIRLADQGHDVHVAYQTSGNTSVWDTDVYRYLEFTSDFCDNLESNFDEFKRSLQKTKSLLEDKKSGQIDPPEIQNAKAFIRKSEAIAAARYAGLKDDNVHFMNLPFYDLRKKAKNFVLDKDVEDTIRLLKKLKPDQIFAAGDFADPHGTHLICFNIIIKAMKELRKKEEWARSTYLWMYRGAWQEFQTSEIQMAVPLSPQEVERKKNAIFKHQSQKDRPVFPGDDEREFWLRVQERNKKTAENYHKLGLANYEAMEAFVKFEFE